MKLAKLKREKLRAWVVIGPNGQVTWSVAFGPMCHMNRHQAINDACRLARWHDELKSKSCAADFEDYTWEQAKKAGFRVKTATLQANK